MKKFRVTVEPEVDQIVLLVEASSEAEAKEKAEEIYSNGEMENYWEEEPYTDSSGTDSCRVVKVEELSNGQEENQNN